MKKKALVFICIFSTYFAFGQVDKSSNSGIGTGGGAKMNYGAWGIFYNYTLPFFNKRIELNSGIGIKQSFVMGVGSKFRIYDNSKRIELFLSCNYSHHQPGKFRYDVNNNLTDYYTSSSTQYMHYHLTSRFWLDRFAAIQLNCGYSQNIGGVNIQHTNGPNESYDQVRKTLNDGVLFGIDLIVFLKD